MMSITPLEDCFQKCREFGISLNPKNTIFTMEEGKLLGHIISKDGVTGNSVYAELLIPLRGGSNLRNKQSKAILVFLYD